MEIIRPAKVSDADQIHSLINYYAEQGQMLHRSLESIYRSLRDFIVCCDGDEVIGCVALVIYWKDLAEIRSLAVAVEHTKKGIGTRLVRQALNEAKKLGLPKVFTLTYVTDFFSKLGFKIVEKSTLPMKVWGDCLHCPRADACDETAMIIELI